MPPSAAKPNPRLPAPTFERLEVLRRAAWDAINERRKHEWQVSISFWTLLAAFIAGISSTNLTIRGCARDLLFLCPLVLSIAHLSRLNGLFHAYTVDKRAEGYFRRKMRELVALDECDYQDATRENEPANARHGPLSNWNVRSQMAATVALGLLAVGIVYVKYS